MGGFFELGANTYKILCSSVQVDMTDTLSWIIK